MIHSTMELSYLEKLCLFLLALFKCLAWNISDFMQFQTLVQIISFDCLGYNLQWFVDLIQLSFDMLYNVAKILYQN